MTALDTITIAICTKDRAADLSRCVHSVLAAVTPDRAGAVELLIIDDGSLPPLVCRRLTQSIERYGCRFRYVKNEGTGGLIRARRLAVDVADAGVILFLDDDTTISRDYLARLAEVYRQDPRLAGVGGIDVLQPPRSAIERTFDRLALIDSGKPGRLSCSGFNGASLRWGSQTQPFESEFLSGCNMSFPKTALLNLPVPEWLKGYSNGEDLLLSYVARQSGRLLADPSLRVQHWRSAESRISRPEAAYFSLMNVYRLLGLYHPSSWAVVALLWTGLCLFIKQALKRDSRMTFAYLKSICHIVVAEIRGTDAEPKPDVDRRGGEKELP